MRIFTDPDGSPKTWLLMIVTLIVGVVVGIQTSRGPTTAPSAKQDNQHAAYMFCQGLNLGIDKTVQVLDEHGVDMPLPQLRLRMIADKLTDAEIIQFVKDTK